MEISSRLAWLVIFFDSTISIAHLTNITLACVIWGGCKKRAFLSHLQAHGAAVCKGDDTIMEVLSRLLC